MNKSGLHVALGAFLTVSGNITQDAFAPPPPPPVECQASAEAKTIIQAQQQTIDKITESLKKSVDSLSQSCQK